MDSSYKSLKKIQKGLENEGYLEWRKSVWDELLELDDRALINKRMRIVIALEKSKKVKKEQESGSIIYSIIAIAMSSITTMINISVNTNTFAGGIAAKVAQVENNIDELNRIMNDSFAAAEMLIDIIGMSCIIFIIYYGIMHWFDKISRRNVLSTIYLEELLKITDLMIKIRKVKYPKLKNKK